MLGLAEAERGAPKTALKIWDNLLKSSENTHAGERGWIYRNAAFLLQDIGDARSAQKSEQYLGFALDAFLQSGDTGEAIKTLGQISKAMETRDVEGALEKFDEMLALVQRDGVMSDEISANLYHAKGKRLLDGRRFKEARLEAGKAIECLCGIHGAEEELISSIHLASIASSLDGDDQAQLAYDAEAHEIEKHIGSAHFSASRRIYALFDAYDPDEASKLQVEADASNNPELISAVGVASVVKNPNLESLEKLAELERIEGHLKSVGASGEILKPARMAMAVLHQELEDYEDAVRCYRHIVDDKPGDVQASQNLLALLWRAEAWGDAAIECAKQLQRFGEGPGYLYAYGRSSFESGDFDGAIKALTRCIKTAEEGSNELSAATKLREEAIELGGSVRPDIYDLTPPCIISLDLVREALNDFAQFIASSKRMTFWQRAPKAKDHKWTPRPEERGQDLLHTFLKARFHEHTRIFEEISTGAGRLDILAQFSGGLSVIIELKICGKSYAASYAQSGEGQIRHYMRTENVNVGFLVVFDARVRKNGLPLMNTRSEPLTIEEIIIDLRPDVQT